MKLTNTGELITGHFMVSDMSKPFEADEICKLVMDGDNPHDPGNAIIIEKDGKKLGYVARDNPRTLISGTIPNTKARDIIGIKSAYVRIDAKSLVKTGNFAYRYQAELLIEEDAPAKSKAEIEFSLGGGFTTYTGKSDLQEKISKVGAVEVRLEKLNDKIIANFNGAPSGFVKASDEDMEILLQYVEDLPGDIVASAYDIQKGAIKCKMLLQAQVKTPTVDLESAIKRIIDEKMLSAEELNEIIDYSKKNMVPVKSIANMLNSYVKYPEHIKKRIKKPETLYVDNANMLPKVVAYMNKGKNLRFEGERGIGKNVLAETVTWMFNRPLWEFSSNSQHSNHSLLGKDTFKSETPEEKNKVKSTIGSLLKFVFPKKNISDNEMDDIKTIASKFLKGDKELVFEKSPIIEAVEYGGVLVLDEFNSSLADVMTILNSLLDSRRRTEIAGLGTIQAHKNFLAIATENKNYAGTFQIHQGTIDRFVPIVFPKPNSIVSVLQRKVPNVNYDILLKVGDFYNRLRDAIADGTLGEDVLTIRGFIDALDVLDEGISLKISLIDNVANKADDLDDREAIKDLINLTFFD